MLPLQDNVFDEAKYVFFLLWSFVFGFEVVLGID